MADFLSSLGITGATPPPASAYSDQKAETTNLADAKSQLTGVMSNIGLATTTAKQLGLDPSYTQSLENLNSEAAGLAGANLTSAQLAAKTTAINDKLANAKATQEAAVRQKAITEMTAANSTIAARLAAVRADNTVPAANLKEYEDHNTAAKAALEALKAPPIPGAAVPVFPSPDELLSKLDELDTALDAALNKVFNWKRLARKVLKIVMYIMAIIACGLGAILGGVIMSNAYAADFFWGIKVFYFIYGAAFFPLSVTYGVIKAPYWVSGLIPLFALEPREVPTEPPPVAVPVAKPVSAVDAAKSKVASLMSSVKLPSVKLPSMKLPSVKLPSMKLPAMFGAKKGGGDSEEIPLPPLPAALPAPPAIPLQTKLFGYKLVDPATPTAAETASKQYLRIAAGVDLTLLIIVAIYYGVDKLILKNKV